MTLTKEQIQWLWEQCGMHRLEYSDGMWSQRLEPGLLLALPIDLNNLFKYAVPILIEKLGKTKVSRLLDDWTEGIMFHDKDPADSLFELIYKALGGKE